MKINLSNKSQLQASYFPLSSNWRSMIAKDWAKHWPLYLMLLPTVLYYLIWGYGPMYGIIIAFKEFTPRKGILGSPWAGFKYFQEFFTSPFAFRLIRNTVMINFWNLVFAFPLPIIFALLLNEVKNTFYKRTVQTITYMPYFVSLVVVCGIIVDFTASDGVLGELTKMLGGAPKNLLSDPKYFRTIYVVSELWQRLGWDSIIFLAALTGINPELYDAAIVDGAGKFKQVIYVTIPGIMPTIAILLILRVGSLMSLGFEKVILLYNPLIYETADVISSYVYRKGIVESNFSFATAVGLFNSVVNFILVILANKISAKMTEVSLW
ncbi:ABC transporter permease subunit [Caldicoprobacter algeriensis]|uniref:ABC transporter permease n=1 Tax=Caldicoprobacter algeriensis TaxID=699281 RepID=UPI00207A492B|nr:ABC transporter permease subunit [Caldicoprobacter algeriensis]MCM8901546.1 ABC transporter permease subunit [Caldicoprobacter algeriensis]